MIPIELVLIRLVLHMFTMQFEERANRLMKRDAKQLKEYLKQELNRGKDE